MIPVVGGKEVGVQCVSGNVEVVPGDVKGVPGLPLNTDLEVLGAAARQVLVMQCINFPPPSSVAIVAPEVSKALLSLCVAGDSNHASPSHVFEFAHKSRLSLPKASTPVGAVDAKELIRALEGGVKILKAELCQIEQSIKEGCCRVEGDKNGYGRMVYANGDRYSGNWVQGDKNGCGRMLYANGDRYSGDWVQGDKNGYGRMLYANGDRYSGHWVENYRVDESGLYVTSECHVYQGKWVDNTEVLSSDFFVHPTRNDLYITTKLCLLFLSYKSFSAEWYCELTHTLLVKILGSLGHDKAKAVIENKVKIDEYIKACQENKNPHGALINVSIGRHAFLLRVRVGEDGELDFILLDSDSREYVRDNKTKTARVFRLKDKEQLISVLQSLREKANINEFCMYLQASGKFKELVESCLVQRVQKIGSCTLDCWLTAIRFDLTNDIEWLNLRIDLFRYVKEHCQKMIKLSPTEDLKYRFGLYAFKAKKKIMRRQKKLVNLLENSR